MYNKGDRVWVITFKYAGTIKHKKLSSFYENCYVYQVVPDPGTIISWGSYVPEDQIIPLTAFGEALLGD